MGTRRAVTAFAAVATLGLGAACTSEKVIGPPTSPGATTGAPVSPREQPASTPPTTAATSAATSAPAGVQPLANGALAPGRYVTDGFAVPMQFDLGEGWSNSHLSESFLDLERPEGVLSVGSLPGVSPGEFLRNARAAGLHLDEPEPGVLDDLPSRRVHVSPVDAETLMYEVDAGTYRIQPGNGATVDLVETADGLLAVTVEAEPANASAAQAAADMVLATATVDADPPSPLIVEEAPLDPGEYESGVFGKRFSIRLGDGWEAAHLGVPVVLLVRGGEALGVFLPDGMETVRDAVRAIRDVPGAHVVVDHGGGPTAVDMTVDGQVEAFTVGGTPVFLFAGEPARFWVFPVGDRIVAVEYSLSADELPSEHGGVPPDVRSMRFGSLAPFAPTPSG